MIYLVDPNANTERCKSNLVNLNKVNMTPSHPGDFIHTEIIEELGLNVTRAAKILGVRRATLSDLLNGNAALSPEMALRIEEAFGVGMDMLLRMQVWYDASHSVHRYEPV